MKLSKPMKRMLLQIGDAWLIGGHQGPTAEALQRRDLISRVTTHKHRGVLLTRQGVEKYLELYHLREEEKGENQ